MPSAAAARHRVESRLLVQQLLNPAQRLAQGLRICARAVQPLPLHRAGRVGDAGAGSRCGSSSTAAHSELEPSRTACARGLDLSTGAGSERTAAVHEFVTAALLELSEQRVTQIDE